MRALLSANIIVWTTIDSFVNLVITVAKKKEREREPYFPIE